MNLPLTTGDWDCAVEARNGLGESPFWHPREERLYWIDIPGQRVWRHHQPSGQDEFWDLPQTPGSIAPCRSGGLLLALRDGIYLTAGWRGSLQKLASAPYDTTRLRFNDGKCDPWGRFWVGTYVETKDRADGALYCLQRRDRPQPELAWVAGGVMSSNGLAWSPDGKTVYWADTAKHVISTMTLPNGGPFPPRTGMPMSWVRFAPQASEGNPNPAPDSIATVYGGRPDGAAVDQAGRYWVAMYEGARVLCLSPQGEVLADIPTPAQCPTMVCFGGRDLRTLFLTTASAKRSAEELLRHPQSGSVFSLRVLTPGLPVNFYED